MPNDPGLAGDTCIFMEATPNNLVDNRATFAYAPKLLGVDGSDGATKN